jgi:uroporphyrinogen decarboxylase
MHPLLCPGRRPSMESREIVKRAIEFRRPPRLPFVQQAFEHIPNDVCNCREMDWARGQWVDFNTLDDWGCRWAVTDVNNMGQVVGHPLEDWGTLSTFRPPDPRDDFYFETMEDVLSEARGRYVMVTSRCTLLERLHMLHGFERTMEDFYLEPKKIEKVLDMILEFKLEHFHELNRRFGDRVDGLFLTDDWGTQDRTFVSPQIFEHYFHGRYRQLFEGIHEHGWHVILHSCGRINDFVPYFIDVGVDMMNMEQPQVNGIEEIGDRFAGDVAFLTTADIQVTLPSGDLNRVRDEVRELVENWSTPNGGMVVLDYGDPGVLGAKPESKRVMLEAFAELMYHWG